MTSIIKTSVSIQKNLFDQAEVVAQQLNVSTTQLFELAIEEFIEAYQNQVLSEGFTKDVEDQGNSIELSHSPNQDAKTEHTQLKGEHIRINQGDIFWIRAENPNEMELGYYPHPYVVVQENILNYSRINSTVVCALTTNLKQANTPGNVLLELGEANLPKHSVVVVSKVSVVHKSQLGEYIGSLNKQRVSNILSGLRFLQLSFFTR